MAGGCVEKTSDKEYSEVNGVTRHTLSQKYAWRRGNVSRVPCVGWDIQYASNSSTVGLAKRIKESDVQWVQSQKRKDMKFKGKNELMTCVCVYVSERKRSPLAVVCLWPALVGRQLTLGWLPLELTASTTCCLPRTQQRLPRRSCLTESTAATGGRVLTLIHKIFRRVAHHFHQVKMGVY